MEIHDIDSTALIAVAVLVSFARLVRVIFATLRTCIEEYDAFRFWLSHVRRAPSCDGEGSDS